MSGLPPVPVPKQDKDRDSGLRWPFLLIGILIGAGLITGGVLVVNGWRLGRNMPTANVPASPFRPDVAVKINSWNRAPRVASAPQAAPGDFLFLNVTVTNHSTERLTVAPEAIGITTTDQVTDYGDTGAFLKWSPSAKETYGREVLPINGLLAPGQSATGDVIVTTTDQAKPLSAGYKL